MEIARVNDWLARTQPASVWGGGTVQLVADTEAEDVMHLRGVALHYDQSAHVTVGGQSLTVQVRPGAARDTLEAERLGTERDILLLHTHDMGRTLARSSNGSLSFSEADTRLDYQARLNLTVRAAVDAAAEVREGLLPHVSVGFSVAPGGGSWEETQDNCGDPQCVTLGQEIDTVVASSIRLYELSLVPQGAVIGTSVLAAQNRIRPEQAEPAKIPVTMDRIARILEYRETFGGGL